MAIALFLGVALWLFYFGMSKWSARATSAEKRWWVLLWGNFLRVGALSCLIGIVYFVGRAIVGC